MMAYGSLDFLVVISLNQADLCNKEGVERSFLSCSLALLLLAAMSQDSEAVAGKTHEIRK